MDDPAVISPKAGDPEVSQSLVGLMGAFDKLKEAVGYSGQDSEEFSAIEHFVQGIEAENAQLRLHAIEAIQVAENLREENNVLLEELTQTRLKDMVEQAAELDKVTHEYDIEVMNARFAEAEAVLEEVDDLRARVEELEEENTSLTEMLNEVRQSQQQLNKLQMMDTPGSFVGTAATPEKSSGGAGGAADPLVTESSLSFRTAVGEASPSPLMPHESTPTSGINGGVALAGAAAAGAAAGATIAATATATPAPAPGPSPQAPVFQTPGSTTAKDPAAVAEALSAVAGGAEGGVAATAARLLRNYATLEASLEEERKTRGELQVEVDRLNEITSAKTFKAPSAWAEREVKYRQEKLKWEEERKDLDIQVSKMKRELDGLRDTSGAAQLEKRIEELEARLLESERDRRAAKAALHELEIQSRATDGEFSLTGVKPYRGPRIGEEGEVQQVVASIESSGGTPTRPFPTTPRTGGLGEVTSAANPGDLLQENSNLRRENTRLRAQLEKIGGGESIGALETPQMVRQALSSSTVKKAKDLEDQLATTQTERAALLAELQALKTAEAERGADEAQRVTLQLRVAETETRTEVALLQRGVDSDSARQLASLAAQLKEAQHREADARAKLEEARTAATAGIVAAGAIAGAIARVADEQQKQQPAAAKEEALLLEQEVASVQRHQEQLQEEMKKVAEAATVDPELLHAPSDQAVPVETLPDEIATFLEEATAASEPPPPPAAGRQSPEQTLPPAAVERIANLQNQLRIAEQALAALEKGTVPVQMHISVSEVGTATSNDDDTLREGKGSEQVQSRLDTDSYIIEPVQMRIAVVEGPTETSVKLPITLTSGEEAVASIRMPINIASPPPQPGAAVPSAAITHAAASPTTRVHMPININVVENTADTVPVHVPIVVREAEGIGNTAGSSPVRVPISITAVNEESVTRVHLPINVSDNTSPAPVHVPITIASDPQKERRMKQLEALLLAANEEEERLRRDLEALVPVKLNFSLNQGQTSPYPGTGMSRRSSAGSMDYSPEGLAKDRAAAEAAYQDHVKSNTDVASLLRDKAELETRCQMLQLQLDKLQGALQDADAEHVQIQESIDKAVRSGDVGLLAGLKEGLRSGKARFTGRNLKVFGRRKPGVSDQDIKTALHDTQDALHETEAERNALRRQLARISKKMDKGTPGKGAAGGSSGSIAAAASALSPTAIAEEVGETTPGGASATLQQELDDVEVEVGALRDENEMLMEHLVSTKVRLAEVEGDFLESRRALLRSREKQLQLARQIMDLQAAELADEPSPSKGSPVTGVVLGGGGLPPTGPMSTPARNKSPERRRSLRLPGLG